MKRLLMYIIVAIVLVVSGVSIYYVVRDDEKITSLVARTDSFCINVGETLEIPIKRENPASYATMTVDDDGWDQNVDIDLDAWTITAKRAGLIELKFRSTNEKYKSETFVIDCKIGDGSVEAPYYLRNEDDLNHIGKFGWHYSDHYELANDIIMTKPFVPIGIYGEDGTIRYDEQVGGGQIVIDEFTGSLSGGISRYGIINMTIEQGDLNYRSAGMFAIIGSAGIVENVRFENARVAGSFFYAGTVAGVCYGTIGKCEIINSTLINRLSIDAYTGGVCGMLNRIDEMEAQINICSSEATIESNYVAGGAVGRNDGGVIFNCKIRTTNLKFNPSRKDESFFGGIAGISKYEAFEGEGGAYDAIYDPFVSNCLVYIDGTNTRSENVCEIFGIYGALEGAYNQESRGTYDHIYYVYGSTSSTLKKYYDKFNEADFDVKEITTAQSMDPDTYEGEDWDFSHVWDLVEGEYMKLGFNGIETPDGTNTLEYQTYSTRTSTSNITKENLIQTLKRMRENPLSGRTYVIAEDIVYDGDDYGTEWEPIGSLEEPFKGKILMGDIKQKDGTITKATITFRNLKINSNFEQTYGGIFGFVYGTNTVIEGIVIDETSDFFEINGQVVGAIAGYNQLAHIQNCKVANFTINASTMAGGLVGINTGVVTDCLINATEHLTEQPVVDEDGNETGETDTLPTLDGFGNVIYETSVTYSDFKVTNPIPDYYDTKGIVLGGLIAKNKGTIKNCTSGGVRIELKDMDEYTSFVGGAIGYNSGVAQFVTVDGLAISGIEYKGCAYAGGIAGWHGGGKIEYAVVSSNSGNSIQFNNANQDVCAGGLAGIMSIGSEINYSVSDSIMIDAFYSAGFAGISSGKIRQSYITTTTKLTSHKAAGFVGHLFNNGLIENCMTAGQINATEYAAGMVLNLEKESRVDLCYIDPRFQEITHGVFEGIKIYAITASETENKLKNDAGKITRSVVVGESDDISLKLPIKINGEDMEFKIPKGYKIKIGGIEAKVQTEFLTFGSDITLASPNQVSTSDELLKSTGFDFTETWNAETNGYYLPLQASKLVTASSMNSSATQVISVYAENVESIDVKVNDVALENKYIAETETGFNLTVALGSTVKIGLTTKAGYGVTGVLASSGTVVDENGVYTYTDFKSTSAALTFSVERVYELKITAQHASKVTVTYGNTTREAVKVVEKNESGEDVETDSYAVQIPKNRSLRIKVDLDNEYHITGSEISSGKISLLNDGAYELINYLESEEEQNVAITFKVEEILYEARIVAPQALTLTYQYDNVSVTLTSEQMKDGAFVLQIPKNRQVKLTITLNAGYSITNAETSSGTIERTQNAEAYEYVVSGYLATGSDASFVVTFTVAA